MVIQDKLDPLENIKVEGRQTVSVSISQEATTSLGSYQSSLLRSSSNNFSSSSELRQSETIIVMEKKSRAFDLLMKEDPEKAQKLLEEAEDLIQKLRM